MIKKLFAIVVILFCTYTFLQGKTFELKLIDGSTIKIEAYGYYTDCENFWCTKHCYTFYDTKHDVLARIGVDKVIYLKEITKDR